MMGEYFFREYNFVDDNDEGDNGVDAEELMRRSKEKYWEPGEIRSRKSQLEMVLKLYEQMFGPDGPQTEELGEIRDAQTRLMSGKPQDAIDDGQPFDIINIITDRASFEKFQSKKPPLAYWVEMRKGRKAWLEKYGLTISHKYKIYFNTPDGALEHVPSCATYVLPDAKGKQSYAVHWEPLLKKFTNGDLEDEK